MCQLSEQNSTVATCLVSFRFSYPSLLFSCCSSLNFNGHWIEHCVKGWWKSRRKEGRRVRIGLEFHSVHHVAGGGGSCLLPPLPPLPPPESRSPEPLGKLNIQLSRLPAWARRPAHTRPFPPRPPSPPPPYYYYYFCLPTHSRAALGPTTPSHQFEHETL